jgi:hypothetical protein
MRLGKWFAVSITPALDAQPTAQPWPVLWPIPKLVIDRNPPMHPSPVRALLSLHHLTGKLFAVLTHGHQPSKQGGVIGLHAQQIVRLLLVQALDCFFDSATHRQ